MGGDKIRAFELRDVTFQINQLDDLKILEVVHRADTTSDDHRIARREAVSLARRLGFKRVLVLLETQSSAMQGETMDLFEFGASFHDDGMDTSFKIAYVRRLENQDVGFIVTVARNRGVNVDDFSNRDEAISWLTEDDCSRQPPAAL